jgi:transcriptional regulator with XRE-family HTH domain
MYETVGQRLRELRKLKGYSQLQLGRLLFEGEKLNENAKQLRISRLEGSESINVETRGRLAKILEVSPTDLLPRHAVGKRREPKEGWINIAFDPRVLDLLPDFEARLKGLSGLTAFGGQLPLMVAQALDGMAVDLGRRHQLAKGARFLPRDDGQTLERGKIASK